MIYPPRSNYRFNGVFSTSSYLPAQKMIIILLTHFTHNCFTGFFTHFTILFLFSRISFPLFLDNAILFGSTFPATFFSSKKATLAFRSSLPLFFSEFLQYLQCAPCFYLLLFIFPLLFESLGLRKHLRTKVFCATFWSLVHKLGTQRVLSNNAQVSGLA